VLAGDGTLAGDGVLAGDADIRAQSTLTEGDETPCMK
jgi:hypothetical protein